MILVTGASGLLGNELLQQLTLKLPGQKIRAISRSTTPRFVHKDVEVLHCDLLDIVQLEEVFADITEVYHCAATVSFNKGDESKIMSDNVKSTENLINIALARKIRKIVFASSIASIGREDIQVGELIDEKKHWVQTKRTSVYSQSKYLSEMEVWRGYAEGLEVAIVNPGIILGKGDWNRSSSTLFRTVAHGLKWYTKGVTAWVDAEDVAKAMILLMASDITGERFIISSGNYSYEQIFLWMAKHLEVTPPRRYASPAKSEIIWRLEYLLQKLTGRESVITKETAHTAHAEYHFSNKKFLKTFPHFQYKSMEDSIEEIARYYSREHRGQYSI